MSRVCVPRNGTPWGRLNTWGVPARTEREVQGTVRKLGILEKKARRGHKRWEVCETEAWIGTRREHQKTVPNIDQIRLGEGLFFFFLSLLFFPFSFSFCRANRPGGRPVAVGRVPTGWGACPLLETED